MITVTADGEYQARAYSVAVKAAAAWLSAGLEESIEYL